MSVTDYSISVGISLFVIFIFSCGIIEATGPSEAHCHGCYDFMSSGL